MKKYLIALALFTATAAIPGTARGNETPKDQASVSLSRTSEFPGALKTRLSQNIYRYENRVERYTETVRYTVQVSYQDVESYTVPVEQCGHENVQSCSPVTRCQTQTSCHSVPGACRQETSEVCQGSGAGRSCTPSTRTACDPPSERCTPTQVCSTDNNCTNRSEYRCHTSYETRYRDVTRERTENRSREEERERTVVDKIFVRQWGIDAQILFQTIADLEEGETESVLIRLKGSEEEPKIEVSIDSPVYQYEIQPQEKVGEAYQLKAKLVAKYSADKVGKSSIAKLRLDRTEAFPELSIHFEDHARFKRLLNQYEIELIDIDAGGKSVFKTITERDAGLPEVVVPITTAIDGNHDHEIRMKVSRSGVVIDAPAAFETQALQKAVINPAPYRDPKKVTGLAVIGSGASADIRFNDSAPYDARVKNQYRVRVFRPTKFLFIRTGWEEIGNAVIDSKSIRFDAPGFISKENLIDYANAEDRLRIALTVMRSSERFPGAQTIEFSQETIVELGENNLH